MLYNAPCTTLMQKVSISPHMHAPPLSAPAVVGWQLAYEVWASSARGSPPSEVSWATTCMAEVAGWWLAVGGWCISAAAVEEEAASAGDASSQQPAGAADEAWRSDEGAAWEGAAPPSVAAPWGSRWEMRTRTCMGESGITLARRVWGRWRMERHVAAEVFNAPISHGSLACVHIFSHGQNNVHRQ